MRDDISDAKSTMDVLKCKIQKPRENLYNKKKVSRLISESALVLNYVIWLISNIV